MEQFCSFVTVRQSRRVSVRACLIVSMPIPTANLTMDIVMSNSSKYHRTCEGKIMKRKQVSRSCGIFGRTDPCSQCVSFALTYLPLMCFTVVSQPRLGTLLVESAVPIQVFVRDSQSGQSGLRIPDKIPKQVPRIQQKRNRTAFVAMSRCTILFTQSDYNFTAQ